MRTPFNRSEIHRKEGEPESVASLSSVERYERCTFCNSKLVFSHDLNFGFLEVVETGRCPGCGVAMSPKRFPLQ